MTTVIAWHLDFVPLIFPIVQGMSVIVWRVTTWPLAIVPVAESRHIRAFSTVRLPPCAVDPPVIRSFIIGANQCVSSQAVTLAKILLGATPIAFAMTAMTEGVAVNNLANICCSYTSCQTTLLEPDTRAPASGSGRRRENSKREVLVLGVKPTSLVDRSSVSLNHVLFLRPDLLISASAQTVANAPGKAQMNSTCACAATEAAGIATTLTIC